ncbi:hypothetical protein PMI01_01229 [Caulobacter sp. AP07]|uniref:hypothetical protein n=1 Tax=Caulobacter sp. AP07 TaxID=1144304 RepID=UPI000271F259|nr:hypothetical protein [Caulobacter sp. AP07]EJL35682.1 hypothetical protein PMI01_01229 [Caulobacter sp. AP07]
MGPDKDLDAWASEGFRYRDLIECGETWTRLRPDNRPRQAATYAAIAALARDVLDPVAKALGQPVLTYGFAGPSLTRDVGGRIAPNLDQHAGHELTARGVPVCPRLGQAVDLHVPGCDARALAALIIDRTPFDRLYLYGPDRPVHVSRGPQETRSVVLMRPAAGRLVPLRLSGLALRRWLQEGQAV